MRHNIPVFCVVFLATLGLIQATFATGTQNNTTYRVIAAPACKNDLGEIVTFETVTSTDAKLAAGMARRDQDGTPTVYRFHYQTAPPALQRFIDLHECAHHQTGDIDRPHPPRNSPDHMMAESIADCIAILRIRDEFTSDNINLASVAKALSTAMAGAKFPEITIKSRLKNITYCHNNYGAADSFITGLLRQRQ